MSTDVFSDIKSDGSGDYTTLAAWEAAKNGDLTLATGNDTRQIALIYDATVEGSFSTVEYVGGTHDIANDNYLLIRAATGNEFDSKLKVGAKIISAASDTTHGLVVRSGQVLHLEKCGISFHLAASNTVFNGGGYVKFKKCTLYNCKRGVFGHRTNTVLENCVIEPSYASSGISGGGGSPNIGTLNNCTVVQKTGLGSYDGDIAVHDCDITNTVIYNDNTKVTYNSWHGSTGNYNAQNSNGSATLPGTNSLNAILSADFADIATSDYTLPAASQLIDAAVVVADYTDDIVDVVRG